MNKERYKDPTADTAIGNVTREEKRKEKRARGQQGNKSKSIESDRKRN